MSRLEDRKFLDSCIEKGQDVELIGMKRVGIGNFLDVFLKESIHIQTKLFVRINIQELYDIEGRSFYTLLLKDFVNSILRSSCEESIKRSALTLEESLQTHGDIHHVKEIIYSILNILQKNNIPVVIFFIRFDRLEPILNQGYFNELYNLKKNNRNLTFVFTSYIPLKTFVPKLENMHNLITYYIKPLISSETQHLLLFLTNYAQVSLSINSMHKLIGLSGGHTQLLRLLVLLAKNKGTEYAIEHAFTDEQIELQCDELFTSIPQDEQKLLIQLVNNSLNSSIEDLYISKSGIVVKNTLFSPIFVYYINHIPSLINQEDTITLTKKEKLLFEVLIQHKDSITEREHIMKYVWPELYELGGVSDWTLDKLVARLRRKLEMNKNGYSIITHKTRGFLLK